jgi:sec-independent protein translocase protein TatA
MFGLGLPEIIILLLVFVMFFFGSGKIVDLAKSLGRFTGEFKKGKIEIENEIREARSAGEGDKIAEKK